MVALETLTDTSEELNSPATVPGQSFTRRAGGYLAQSLIVAWIVVTLVFGMIRLVPGDPARVLLGPRATPEQLESLRQQLGLDLPVWQQYLNYMADLLRGDLGTSITQGEQSVTSIVLGAVPATLALILISMLVSTLLGVPIGLAAAVTRRRWVDNCIRISLVVLLATPSFFIGILLILGLALQQPLLPAGGWANAWPENLWYLVLPVVTLSCYLTPLVARTARQAAKDVYHQQYVEAAIARGTGRVPLMLRHLLPNSSLPVITLLGLNLGGLITGAVVVEAVFAVPGIGAELVKSVGSRDYPVIQGVAVVSALAVIASSLTTELLIRFVDPRTRAVR